MAEVKILIIEDDPVFADEVKMMVEELGYALPETVNSLRAALDAIDQAIPDLMLISTNLKCFSTKIDDIYAIKNLNIPFIFLANTSDQEIYDQAKLFRPHGFMLRPFHPLALQSTIETALFYGCQVNINSEVLQAWKEDLILNESLFVKNNNKLFKVNVRDILVIEADGNYSILNTVQRKYAIKTSLRQLKLKLSARLFVQIHRNYIVQIPHIENIDMTAGEVHVNNKNYPLGGKFKHQFINQLKQL
ncbi:MAG: response regulator transcription factor [Saprospiraceae bacterium]